MSYEEKIPIKQATVPLLKKKSFERMTEGYKFYPKPDCNKCVACQKKANIVEYTEIPPLIATDVTLIKKSKCHDKLLLILFGTLVLTAATISILLIIAATESDIIEEFDYVTRNQWGLNNSMFSDVPRLERPVSKILLLELDSGCDQDKKNCLNYDEFKENTTSKMRVNGGVLYNFYQAEKGKMFEGRGWTYQFDCEDRKQCSHIATIALLDTSQSPASWMRKMKLRAFLDFSISNRYLSRCFKVQVRHSDNFYFDDIAHALDDMVKKDGECQYRQ